MTPTGKLQTVSAAPIALRGTALPALPARQGMWVGAQMLVAGFVSVVGLWAMQPELALSIAIGAGAGSVNPKKMWALPIVTVAVALAGLLFTVNQLPAVVGAGAVAGALATWLLPHRTDWLDHVNGALATLTGSSLGLWAATALLPNSMPLVISAIVTAGLVGLMGSQGLLPAAIRFDNGPDLPSPRQIQAELQLRYRPPVFRALELYEKACQHAPDRDTRGGLAEVAMWVYRLQLTRQTLDAEAESIDPVSINDRIDRYENPDPEEDEFTRERHAATAAHLKRLLEHRALIDVEIRRNDALVEYALAFLEEARAGLAVARELPGETMPERLDEVLGRLRSHAKEGDTRRKTAREVGAF
ncbi:MAG: hypothetical protein H6737_12880 [Alphaproteobacteria bacterium]|nr:hypothetical protein [Alphaproteobacteria bacterium]